MTRRESRSGGARAPGGKGERLDEPVSRDYGLEDAFKGGREGKAWTRFPLLSYDCYDFDLVRNLSDRTVAPFLSDLYK